MRRVPLDRAGGRRLLPVDLFPDPGYESLERGDRLLDEAVLLAGVLRLGEIHPVRVVPVYGGDDCVAPRAGAGVRIIDGKRAAGRVKVRKLPAAERRAVRGEDKVSDVRDRLPFSDAEIDLA